MKKIKSFCLWFPFWLDLCRQNGDGRAHWDDLVFAVNFAWLMVK